MIDTRKKNTVAEELFLGIDISSLNPIITNEPEVINEIDGDERNEWDGPDLSEVKKYDY